jgi:hypothetical protein
VFVRTNDGYASMVSLADTKPTGAWSSLGLQVLGAPAATWSPDGQTLDVFAVDAGGRIMRRQYRSATWTAWSEVPGNGAAGCAVANGPGCTPIGVARCGDAINLFVRGTDGQAYAASISPAGAMTAPWHALGQLVMGAPSATCTADGRTLELAAVGADSAIYTRRSDPGLAAGGWTRAPGSTRSGTVAIAERAGVRHLLGRGRDGAAYYETLAADGRTQIAWKSLGKTVTGAPAASWSGDRTLDVVALDTQGRILRRQYVEGKGWKSWATGKVASTRVQIAERPAIPGRPAVDSLLLQSDDASGYSMTVEPLGGLTAPSPAPLGDVLDAPSGSWSPDGRTLDVVGVAAGGQVQQRRYADGSWSAWSATPDAPRATAPATVAGTAAGVTIALRAADGDGYVRTISRSGQLDAGWQRLGGPLLGSPSLSWTPEGKTLDVVAVGTDRRIYRRQFNEGRGWTAWREAPGDGRAGSATVGLAGNGDSLTSVIRGADGDAQFETISRSGPLLASWKHLNKAVLDAPAATWNGDATRLVIVAVGTDSEIWRRWYVRGEGWSAWSTVPSPAGAPALAVPASDPAPRDPILVAQDEPAPAVGPPAEGIIGIAPWPAPAETGPVSEPPPDPSGGLPEPSGSLP